MPFTISHVAAVLPLPRKRLVFSALVFGSVSPDLPHLILLPEVSRYGHSLAGLFVASVPLGFAALALFHFVLKNPLLALSPDTIRLRVPVQGPFQLGPASRTVWILVSVLIGAITHILWDSFTHAHGSLVTAWPLLRDGTPFWPYRPIYQFLQPFFSVIGLAAIWLVSWNWIRRTPLLEEAVVPQVFPASTRVASLAAGAVLIGTLGLTYSWLKLGWGSAGFWTVLAQFLFGSMAAGFLITLLYSAYWHLGRHRVPMMQRECRRLTLK